MSTRMARTTPSIDTNIVSSPNGYGSKRKPAGPAVFQAHHPASSATCRAAQVNVPTAEVIARLIFSLTVSAAASLRSNRAISSTLRAAALVAVGRVDILQCDPVLAHLEAGH